MSVARDTVRCLNPTEVYTYYGSLELHATYWMASGNDTKTNKFCMVKFIETVVTLT